MSSEQSCSDRIFLRTLLFAGHGGRRGGGCEGTARIMIGLTANTYHQRNSGKVRCSPLCAHVVASHHMEGDMGVTSIAKWLATVVGLENVGGFFSSEGYAASSTSQFFYLIHVTRSGRTGCVSQEGSAVCLSCLKPRRPNGSFRFSQGVHRHIKHASTSRKVLG